MEDVCLYVCVCVCMFKIIETERERGGRIEQKKRRRRTTSALSLMTSHMLKFVIIQAQR